MRIFCLALNPTVVIAFMCILCYDTATCSELIYDPALYDPELSVDFAQFLSTLDEKVYISKAKRQKDTGLQEEHADPTTLTPIINRITTAANERQQMEDALMMKLVSYYEEKFKLSRQENYEKAITELPWLDLKQFTVPTFSTKSREARLPVLESANIQPLGDTPAIIETQTYHSTPAEPSDPTTSLAHNIESYDDMESMFVPPPDYGDDGGFFEVILPGQ